MFKRRGRYSPQDQHRKTEGEQQEKSIDFVRDMTNEVLQPLYDFWLDYDFEPIISATFAQLQKTCDAFKDNAKEKIEKIEKELSTETMVFGNREKGDNLLDKAMAKKQVLAVQVAYVSY